MHDLENLRTKRVKILHYRALLSLLVRLRHSFNMIKLNGYKQYCRNRLTMLGGVPVCGLAIF